MFFIIIFTYLPELNIHIQNGPEVLNMLVPCLNPHWQELWKKKNAHLWRHLWVNFTRLNELGKVSNCSDWCHYSPQKKSAETILSKNNKEIKVPNRPNRVRCIELAWQVLHGQNDDEKRCFLKYFCFSSVKKKSRNFVIFLWPSQNIYINYKLKNIFEWLIYRVQI